MGTEEDVRASDIIGHPHDRTRHHRVPHPQATAPPGRTREATGHKTEKEWSERRKDHIMRCRRGGTPRGSRTVVVLYGYIVTYGYIFACVPPDNRITALPGRMYEATRHHTEKECGERRKDRRMRHDGRRHNAIRHGPSCLGSPPPVVPRSPSPVVPRLPTARRASAPHRPSCLGSPSPVMCNGLASRRPVIRPMPRPNMACSRRRQPRFANVYSFASPWRFMNARWAARLRRGVGPLATPKAGAGRSRQRDIIGHRPGITEHIPNIFRTYSGIVEHEKFGACGSAGRRIACHQARRGGNGPSPDRVP